MPIKIAVKILFEFKKSYVTNDIQCDAIAKIKVMINRTQQESPIETMEMEMVFFILFLVNSVIVTINNIQLAKNPKLLSNKSTTDEIILTTKNAVKSKANFDLLHLMFVVLIKIQADENNVGALIKKFIAKLYKSSVMFVDIIFNSVLL